MYHQKKGGAIGLKTTGAIAKVYIEERIQKFRQLIEKTRMKVYLLVKKLDDVLGITNTLEPGPYERRDRSPTISRTS